MFPDDRIAWQGVEDVTVKDENAVKLAAGPQGQAQGGVVGYPQITAKPHQTRIEFLVDDHR